MKRITSYLVCTFVALALIGTLTTCVPEYLEPGNGYGGNGMLSVKSTVSEATLVTRATTETTESDATLMEKQLNTLDVFVEHVTNGVGDGTFLQQYHLPYPSDYDYPSDVPNESKKIGDQVKSFLKDHWRQGQGGNDGLKFNDYYNIYVAVNNTKTTSNVESVTALKALTYSEVEEGLAVVNEATNNISWPWTDQFAHTPSGFIYKQYVDGDDEEAVNEVTVDGDLYGFTTKKEFMMDGVIENWTPVAGSKDQVFGDDNKPLVLNRAAAKFVLNVKFDATFLKSLQYKKNDDGTYTELKPENERITITGKPAWRFYNFAFGAPVFTPETQGAGVEVHSSETLLKHPYAYAGDDKHFQIITYSYPNKWATADYSTSAPSLVISVGYTEGNGNDAVTNYHYYRIPLVKSTVTAIERNHIYVINATIATKGSASMEDQDVTEDIKYAVLPWNDKSNSIVHENDVEAVQHMYLKVNPKVYTLHGDDAQSLTINYLKASGTSVGWKLFTINTTTGEKGNAVESTANNAVWGWFYDKNGNMKTSYSNWTHMGVTITQSDEGTSGSKGTVTVTSTALDNRAIKYMLLRVYLKDSPSLYEDVLIRHFPTDNIQSITGKWSSYHTGGSSREDTWDPEAAGWEPGTYESEEVEVSASDPYDRREVKNDGTPTDHDATDYRVEYSTGQNNSTVQTQYRNNVSRGRNRYNTNGENNAVEGSDGYWYWGSESYYIGNNGNDYDWRQDRWGNYDGNGSRRYRWTNYYRSKYKKTHYYRTRYYRETIVTNPVTGDWVDWERDAGQRGTTKYVVRSDDPAYTDDRFHAHIFNNGSVHNINSSNNNMASVGNDQERYNNHMYIVQISATSDKYVLGKPLVDNTTHQSEDDVVSPAFMIASQLGIVSTGWSSASAAEHCSRYLEVTEDGTRYAGWRLPTNDEIDIINEYQRGRFGNITVPEADRVMDYVLRGSHYFNLSGGTTPITAYTGGDGNYLRCVRDLSADEIERLNGFDAIIEKYR